MRIAPPQIDLSDFPSSNQCLVVGRSASARLRAESIEIHCAAPVDVFPATRPSRLIHVGRIGSSLSSIAPSPNRSRAAGTRPCQLRTPITVSLSGAIAVELVRTSRAQLDSTASKAAGTTVVVSSRTDARDDRALPPSVRSDGNRPHRSLRHLADCDRILRRSRTTRRTWEIGHASTSRG